MASGSGSRRRRRPGATVLNLVQSSFSWTPRMKP